MNLVEATLAWLSDPAHWSGPAGIPTRLVEHLALSGASLAISIAVAIPAGIWIGHTGRFAKLAVNTANVWRALPSLALIGLGWLTTSPNDPCMPCSIINTTAREKFGSESCGIASSSPGARFDDSTDDECSAKPARALLISSRSRAVCQCRT